LNGKLLIKVINKRYCYWWWNFWKFII